ncbi:MAG: polyhydroxyalkanoic acid system family protein [bacterium]|nr:polyhydroxyalkanoic acid system family protein [Candidatus Kapabacteria bacterium]
MPTIDIVRSHKLGRAEARKAVTKLAADIAKKLDAKTSWEGDTLEFKRSGAKGSIDVEEKKVRVNVELGLLLTPMRGMIEKEINSYLDQYF